MTTTRKVSTPWRIADELKGRTLRQLTQHEISLHFTCEGCNRIAVWPWPFVRNARTFQPLMNKQVYEFAGRLRCIGCEGKRLSIRSYAPEDSAR
jgi:hypothetical protein